MSEPERWIVLLRTSMLARRVGKGATSDLDTSTRQIPFAPAPDRTCVAHDADVLGVVQVDLRAPPA